MVGLLRHSQRKQGANGQALPTAHGARTRLYEALTRKVLKVPKNVVDHLRERSGIG